MIPTHPVTLTQLLLSSMTSVHQLKRARFISRLVEQEMQLALASSS